MDRQQDPQKAEQIVDSHLEHKVDSTSVRGNGHSTAFWDRLAGCQRYDGLRVRQGLDLQIVLLHQGHCLRVYTLEVAWGGNGILKVRCYKKTLMTRHITRICVWHRSDKGFLA